MTTTPDNECSDASTEIRGMLAAARTGVQLAAAKAKTQLSAARALLLDAGFEQVRVDQLQAGPIMVETGYVYGETRLTVHTPVGTTDLRLTGWSDDKFDEFRQLAVV